jgi:S1-C subfamily serine protease
MIVAGVAGVAIAAAPPARPATAFTASELSELSAGADVATVRLAARACPGVIRGSGFVVDRLLFTSAHLVRFDDRVKVDRPGLPVLAAVLATSGTADVAVADGTDLLARDLRLAEQRAGVGEPVLLAGHPAGSSFVAVEARVYAYAPAADWGVPGRTVMLIDPGTSAGFSGGPVLDRTGNVVGMLAGVDATTGLTLAIPADELRTIVESAMSTWTGPGRARVIAHVAQACGE